MIDSPDEKQGEHVEAAVRPETVNVHPCEVVVDPHLSKDEKARGLDAMEQDARQQAVAADEGMSPEVTSGLSAVLAAKESLELPPFELAVSVVLQGFEARLHAARGTDAQASLSQAIEAVKAARAVMEVGSGKP